MMKSFARLIFLGLLTASTATSAATITDYQVASGGELRINIQRSGGGPTTTTTQKMTGGSVSFGQTGGKWTLLQPLSFTYGALTAVHSPTGFTVNAPEFTILFDAPWSGTLAELEAGAYVAIEHIEYSEVTTFDLNGQPSPDDIVICGPCSGGFVLQLIGNTLTIGDAATPSGLINVTTGFPEWHQVQIGATPVGSTWAPVPEPGTGLLIGLGLLGLSQGRRSSRAPRVVLARRRRYFSRRSAGW